ncbi:hypothetical protein [Streptomyces parvulus]|uniref:hypothetical protein n=1 Tax=Streptomyces parvulus TaxID=146923 RepID=UPI0033B9A4E2
MKNTPRRPRANHPEAIANARSQPGVWLPVAEYGSTLSARTLAYRIRTGKPLGDQRYGTPYRPASAFEARTELTENGARLDIRYTARQETTPR